MNKSQETNLKELFETIKNCKEDGFEKLYDKYNKVVYKIAFSILKNKEDSEDIVQTVFTKIYKIDKDSLPTNNEFSWLYTVTKNESLSFLRNKRECFELEKIYDIEDSNNEINTLIDIDSYNRLIRKLNNKEKEIISLKVLSNFSFQEIAKLLNEPVGTIKWRYYKSMSTLKILLGNLGMFIITFVIGLKTILNKKDITSENKINQEINQNVTITENTYEGTTKNDETESTNSDKEILQDIQEENKNINSENGFDENRNQAYTENKVNENQIQQEVIVQENQNTENSYYGVGMLSISAIFLIITIIFLIFYRKYQPKLTKKSSK